MSRWLLPCCSQRNWNDQQASEQALMGWPEHMFENFAVVGLAPDMEITKIAEDLCGEGEPGP